MLFIIINYIDGIAISELKKQIRDDGNRDSFGKEFNKLDIFIKTHYPNEFSIKRRGNSFVITKI